MIFESLVEDVRLVAEASKRKKKLRSLEKPKTWKLNRKRYRRYRGLGKLAGDDSLGHMKTTTLVRQSDREGNPDLSRPIFMKDPKPTHPNINQDTIRDLRRRSRESSGTANESMIRQALRSLLSEGGGSRSDKGWRQMAFLRKATDSHLERGKGRGKGRLRRSSWDKYGHADDPDSVFVTKDGREPSHPRNVQRFLKSLGATIDAKTNKRKVVGPSGKLPG